MISNLFNFLNLTTVIPSSDNPVGHLHYRIPKDEGVLVQIFFPIETETNKKSNAYRKEVIQGSAQYAKSPFILFDSFLGCSRHICFQDGQICSKFEKLPILFFSHGLGGNADIYSKLCSDIASSGFLVIALEHEDGSGSYASTSKGEIIQYKFPPPPPLARETVIEFRKPFLEQRRKEVTETVHFFTSIKEFPEVPGLIEKLDFRNIFIGGHSFGAASSVFTAKSWENSPLKGLLLYDIWSYPFDCETGITNIPICLTLSEEFARNNEAKITAEFLQKSNNVYCQVYLPGSVHGSFSDVTFWFPKKMAKALHLQGEVSPEILLKASSEIGARFLKTLISDEERTGFQTSILETISTAKEFKELIGEGVSKTRG